MWVNKQLGVLRIKMYLHPPTIYQGFDFVELFISVFVFFVVSVIVVVSFVCVFNYDHFDGFCCGSHTSCDYFGWLGV